MLDLNFTCVHIQIHAYHVYSFHLKGPLVAPALTDLNLVMSVHGIIMAMLCSSYTLVLCF